MVVISHRGNIDGSKSECENNPTYIQQALDQGFEVEVDVPEGFHLDGIIPYDVTISKNKGIFKIFASSKEDAQKQIDSYIQKNMQE
jgi:hypothetical protein